MFYIFNMDLLPTDIMKLVIDIYYTPIIKSKILDDTFFIILNYPSHKIKLKIHKPGISMFNRGGIGYDYKDIIIFLDKMHQENCELEFDSITINVKDLHLYIINENTTIKLSNTENVRNQLNDVLDSYIEYLREENMHF